MTLLDCPTATVNPACVHKVPYVFDFDCQKKLMLSRVFAGLISACYVSSIVIAAMSRAVEPGRSLGRDSSQGFVEPLREDVPLKGLIAPLDSMPPVDFAFAYGSGVFTQALHSRARSNEDMLGSLFNMLGYVCVPLFDGLGFFSISTNASCESVHVTKPDASMNWSRADNVREKGCWSSLVPVTSVIPITWANEDFFRMLILNVHILNVKAYCTPLTIP
ncbi:hypothetical protein KC19_10G174800 [Ceratodon purpureus]|uniref:Uncharacterized protein n=1 Tax=Ceratodon purpureus TaxID=3225 RepID=A0A8T0GMV8_CERPU|nr:hypothetical protein KC19_10G174800 [Ceratodon purpureus]